MATTVRVHGGALGVRHDFTKKPDDDPQMQLLEVQRRIRLLTAEHAKAKATLHLALESDGDGYDFNGLKSIVHRKARELQEAEEEAASLENLATERQLDRLPKLIAELRSKRDEFIRSYRSACAALGELAKLSGEALELTNLEARLCASATNGEIHYSSHRNEVLELAACPRPLEGFAYSPISHWGYDWQLLIVPIQNSHMEEK